MSVTTPMSVLGPLTPPSGRGVQTSSFESWYSQPNALYKVLNRACTRNLRLKDPKDPGRYHYETVAKPPGILTG